MSVSALKPTAWTTPTTTIPTARGRRPTTPLCLAIVNTGVAVTRIIEEHPVNINTFASEIVLPSYERMDEVAVLKVVA